MRKTIATGFAYQIFEDARTNLSIKAGPGYVWEDFSKDLGKDNFVGIWALRLTHILDRKWNLQAVHNHRLRQSLESSSEYILKSKTGLRLPIFDNFQATLQFNFDRDNDPSRGTEKNETKNLLTAGYVW